jgi:DNA-binding CsgD family transcriptional regulator
VAGIVADSSALCAFNRRPSGTPTMVEGTLEVLARGVSIRVVYDSTLLANEVALAAARACVAAGEQARVLPGLPVSMVIGDAVGCLSLPGSQGEVPDRVVLRTPRLLTAMRDIFESLWDKAIPISERALEGEGAHRNDDDRILLSLLSVGLTDSAIGRELGISERTVRRRIVHLQALLGAITRFQLGAQAARHGWLSDL